MEYNSSRRSLGEKILSHSNLRGKIIGSSVVSRKEETRRHSRKQSETRLPLKTPKQGQFKLSFSGTSKLQLGESESDIMKDFVHSKQSSTQQLAYKYFLVLEGALTGSRRTPKVFLKHLSRISSQVERLLESNGVLHKKMLMSMQTICEDIQEEIPSHLDTHIKCVANFAVFDSSQPTFSVFSDKNKDALTAKHNFNDALAEISAKKLLGLRSIKVPDCHMLSIAEAFLLLFYKVDKNIRVGFGLNVLKSSVWSAFLAYISNPGNVILTLRKFPSLVENGKIAPSVIKKSQEAFKKAKCQTLNDIYDILKACYRLYKEIKKQKVKTNKEKGSFVSTSRRINTETDNLDWSFRVLL